MKTPLHPLLLPLPLLALAFAACPTEGGGDDDDDDATDDDDSAAGDDDDAVDDDDAAACDAYFPFTMEVTGNSAGSYAFTNADCRAQGSNVWQWRYETDDDWVLRVLAGPIEEGVVFDPVGSGSLGSLDITFLKEGGGKDGVTYTGRSSQGHTAAVDVQVYQGPEGPPCAMLTTAALTTFDGLTVQLGPQPLPLHCP